MEIIYLDNESVEEDNSSKRKAPSQPPSPQLPPPQFPPPLLEKPADFTTCKNKLEICTWLVERPDILHLASQMLRAKESSNVDDISIRSSSVGSVPDAINNISAKIDPVRIISYFVIHFFFFFFTI